MQNLSDENELDFLENEPIVRIHFQTETCFDTSKRFLGNGVLSHQKIFKCQKPQTFLTELQLFRLEHLKLKNVFNY